MIHNRIIITNPNKIEINDEEEWFPEQDWKLEERKSKKKKVKRGRKEMKGFKKNIC